MYIGIKDGKVFDIVDGKYWKSNIKTNSNIPIENYLYVDDDDLCFGDTWDFENNISLKDAPQRFIEPPKSKLQLKIEDLENRILELETKEAQKS